MPSSIHARLRLSPVEMSDLAVGAVAHLRGGQPARRTVFGDRRHEVGQPEREFLRSENPAHEVRLGQTRRKKILSAWFVSERTAPIAAVQLQRAAFQQGCHLRVARGPRPVQNESEGKGGLGMLPGSDRVGQLREPTRQCVLPRRFRAVRALCSRAALRGRPMRAVPRPVAAARQARTAARTCRVRRR